MRMAFSGEERRIRGARVGTMVKGFCGRARRLPRHVRGFVWPVRAHRAAAPRVTTREGWTRFRRPSRRSYAATAAGEAQALLIHSQPGPGQVFRVETTFLNSSSFGASSRKLATRVVFFINPTELHNEKNRSPDQSESGIFVENSVLLG